MFIELPLWKCYLYTLLQRWRRFKAINTSQHRWGFNHKEVILLKQMCFKYLVKGGTKLLKSVRYDELINQVLGNHMVAADPKEIELANQLLIIKLINPRRLLMELKELKDFGKEVGLKLAQMNKMSEEELILEIIRNVEPKVQYSKELVAWYNELPDEMFDQAEAESGASAAAGNDAGISINDVIEVIEGYSKKAELMEILEDKDVAELFKGFDASAYKLPTQLKKAMIDHLKTPAPEPSTGNGGDDQLNEILELINECENEDQLVEVYSEYQSVFEDMEVPDDVDEETLQSLMIDHVNSKQPAPAAEEPETKKPMTLQERLAAKKKADEGEGKTTAPEVAAPSSFPWWNPDDPNFDADNAFTEAEKLKMPTLRSFAKFIGLKVGIKVTKDEILDLIANRIQEVSEGVSESTTAGKVEITAELISDAVKAKDRDALVEMCSQLNITLNAIQKRSIQGMSDKLIEAIGEPKDAPPVEQKTTIKSRLKKDAAPAASDQSIYATMEQMVLDGKSEDAIIKTVSPIYKEKGKSIIFIKKRVATMIQIIKLDNDME